MGLRQAENRRTTTQKAVFRIISPDLTRRSAPKDDRSRTGTRLREARDVLRIILWFWHFHFKLLGFNSLVYIFSYVGKMILLDFFRDQKELSFQVVNRKCGGKRNAGCSRFQLPSWPVQLLVWDSGPGQDTA